MYSDGLVEATNSRSEEYGASRLRELLVGAAQFDPHRVASRLYGGSPGEGILPQLAFESSCVLTQLVADLLGSNQPGDETVVSNGISQQKEGYHCAYAKPGCDPAIDPHRPRFTGLKCLADRVHLEDAITPKVLCLHRFLQTPKAGSRSLTRPGDLASNESPQRKIPKNSPI
jgi:hypothetical protein